MLKSDKIKTVEKVSLTNMSIEGGKKMVFQKLKKISAMTLAAAMVVTSVPVGDYTTILASAKGQVGNVKNVVSVDGSDLQEDEAGVYKVTMDENGNLTSDTDYDPDGELAGNENTPFSPM